MIHKTAGAVAGGRLATQFPGRIPVKEKTGAVFAAPVVQEVPFACYRNYSGWMASTGQTSTHEAQSVHFSGSIT
jgi:hypothetical protein